MTETLFLQEFDSEAVGWIFSGKFDFLEDYKIQREFCLNHIGIRKKTMIKVGNSIHPNKNCFIYQHFIGNIIF